MRRVGLPLHTPTQRAVAKGRCQHAGRYVPIPPRMRACWFPWCSDPRRAPPAPGGVLFFPNQPARLRARRARSSAAAARPSFPTSRSCSAWISWRRAMSSKLGWLPGCTRWRASSVSRVLRLRSSESWATSAGCPDGPQTNPCARSQNPVSDAETKTLHGVHNARGDAAYSVPLRVRHRDGSVTTAATRRPPRRGGPSPRRRSPARASRGSRCRTGGCAARPR